MKIVAGKTIQAQILETLRDRLVCLPEGSRFQTEHELCIEFGVARTTMTRVMVKLVEEGLLHRVPGRGSFVQRIKKNRVPITFLLPCADFLSETFADAMAQNTRRILKGASQVAFEHDCGMVTVPVSPTNQLHDIDWRKLDFINSESKVLAYGYWYGDLFPLLRERGCKVSFVETQTCYLNMYADCLESWFVLTVDRISAMKSAVKRLTELGCRRIALAHGNIDEKDHPSLLGYKSGLRECGHRYSAAINTSDASNETIAGIIADFYKQNKFDALLLDPRYIFKLRTQHSLNCYLGLPENMKIIVDYETGYNHSFFPSLSSMDFPYEEIGRAAAQRLQEDIFKPGRQIFGGRIIERESTMHETEQLTVLTTN